MHAVKNYIENDCGIIVEIYQSLTTYIIDTSTDEMFDDYKVHAVEKTGISNFKMYYST